MSDNGNQLARPTKTGLHVRARAGLQLRDERVRRLKRKLYVLAPWLTEADDPMARRFCELQVLIEQVYAWIRATGVVSEAGEVKGPVDAHRRLTLAQAQIANALGLTPASRTQLKLSSRGVFDLPSAMIEQVTEIGESRAAERAQRAQESKADE